MNGFNVLNLFHSVNILKCSSNKTFGFTLAEVLITLGIIGIVAAMTIPTLMKNTQDIEFKSAWKKAYSDIANATNLIIQDNGGTLIGVLNYDATLPDLDTRSTYGKYLHYAKTGVYSSTNEVCWPKTVYYQNNTEQVQSDPHQCAQLPNGTLIKFDWWYSPNCDAYTAVHPAGICQKITIDVNGLKKPNKWGSDIYGIWVEKNKITPFGTSGDSVAFTQCSSNGEGYGCGAKSLSE